MDILYSCTDFTVCVKPADIDSEVGMPQALSAALGGEFFPVHRLDANVGGIMVYARNKNACALLSRAFAEGKTEKEYVALVHGTPPPFGEMNDLLFKDSRRNKVYVVSRPRAGVKQARLSSRLLEAGECSLVRIKLHTGRSHQIRVQFASRGFPLVGDHKYGSRAPEKAPLLFSCRLCFPFGEEQYGFDFLPPWARQPSPPGE